MITNEEYIRNEKNSNLNIGDKVVITRVAYSRENGWMNSWIHPEMSNNVERTVTIKGISSRDISRSALGIRFEEIHFSYPYFILKKVSKEIPIKKIKVKISNQIFELPECIVSRL